MSLPADDDLLSAYYDGELLPEQRSAIEELLNQSAETRRELAEYRALSRRLRELPPETAAPDFAESVLADCRRLQPTVQGRSKHHRRQWIALLAGVPLTALAVLLIVRFLPDPVPSRTQIAGTEDLVTESAAPQASMPPVKSQLERAESSEEEMLASSAVAPAAAGVTRPSEIGRILQLTGSSDERVAVIEVTVIDIQQGLGGLQVLLAKNAVLPRKTSAPQEKLTAGPGDLYAVYIQASPAQLAASLSAMHREPMFQSIRVADTMPLDTLLADSDHTTESLVAPSQPAAIRRPRFAPQADAAKADAPKSESSLEAREFPAVAEMSRKRKHLESYQLVLRNEKLRKQLDRQAPGEPTVTKNEQVSPQRPADESVRVLFVVRPGLSQPGDPARPR